MENISVGETSPNLVTLLTGESLVRAVFTTFEWKREFRAGLPGGIFSNQKIPMWVII
jgi:hypothetical protein